MKEEGDSTEFEVLFTKKNGEQRRMLCKFGVTEGLKGGKLPFDPKEKQVLSVFDVEKEDYRMINLDGLISVKINNINYVVRKLKEK